MIGVVLESGQAIEQAGATFVNEKRGSDASVRIAQSTQDFSPAVDALDIGGGEPKSEAKVLLRDGGAVGLATEHIGPGREAAEQAIANRHRSQAEGNAPNNLPLPHRLAGVHVMAAEHFVNGSHVLLGKPQSFGMLIDDEHVAVAVQAGEQDDCIGQSRNGE